MKKLILILAIVFVSSLTAKAQNYGDLMRDVNFGRGFVALGGTALGYTSSPSIGSVQLELAFFGLYMSISGNESKHDAKFKEGYNTKFGYQFPITKSIRVIPTVGMCNTSKEYIDNTNEYSDHYGYVSTKKNQTVDYGATLVANYKFLIINANATAHSIG